MLQAKTLSGGAEGWGDGEERELSWLPCHPARIVCAHKQFDCIGICLSFFFFLPLLLKTRGTKWGWLLLLMHIHMPWCFEGPHLKGLLF